jgi:preprotein translocase SecE subunit
MISEVYTLKKIVQFLLGVKKETKKVKWPSRKQLVTYSIATLSFMIITGLFFTGLDIAFSYVKTLLG